MATYRLGSSGEEVRRIQEGLRSLGLYMGPIDGSFGGGTDGAVRRFQASKGLEVDGAVGPITWDALFEEEVPAPAHEEHPVAYRCLALTGAFETGKGIPDCFAGLSGDFDRQGLSLGVCQWNFGQGSLQPLLQEMLDDHRQEMEGIFQENLGVLEAALQSSQDDLMAFARSIQDPVRHFIFEPWRGMFRSLGRSPTFQSLQLDHAVKLLDSAARLCREFGLSSERALALLFDIVVQNGSINDIVKARIRGDFRSIPAGLSPEEAEVARMRIVANRRAEAAKPEWVEDVRARKLCIANGGGTVHGITYDLEEQFGIGLGKAVVS